MMKIERLAGAGAVLVGLTLAPCGFADDAAGGQAPYATSAHVLVGPVWQLAELNGEPAAENIETSLTFSESGEIGGNGGCNSYGGDYAVDGESLSFTNIFSTMMACPGQESPQEQTFLAALEATLSFEIVDEELLLKDREGDTLARLEQ